MHILPIELNKFVCKYEKIQSDFKFVCFASQVDSPAPHSYNYELNFEYFKFIRC